MKKFLFPILIIFVAFGFWLAKPAEVFADTETLRPSADYAVQNYQYPSSGSHYDKVNEVTANGFTNYVYNTLTSYLSDLYNLPAPSGSGTINFIKVYFVARTWTSPAGYARPVLRTYNTVHYGTAVSLSTSSFTTYSQRWSTNPYTGSAWTWDEIDVLQIGVSLKTGLAGYNVYCTQVYVEVDYTPAVVTAPTVTNSTGESNVTTNSARLNGEVTAGYPDPTVHIYWGDNDGGITASSWDHDENLGTKSGTFYKDISELSPSTPYYYRCYAINSEGSDWADSTESFTTTEAGGENTETFYSTASDGHINKSGTNYSTAHDASSGNVVGHISYIGQVYTYSYGVYRGFVFFDTSSLGDAEISAATLTLKVRNNYADKSFIIRIQNGQPTYPHDPLIATDYYYVRYSGDGGEASISKSDTSIGINLNSTGLNWINKTGTTKLCLRSVYDINKNTPSGNEYVRFYTSEDGGDNRPKLEVTYTSAGPSVPTVTTDEATISSTQLENDQATLKGNVTDTGGENPSQRVLEWGTSSGNYTSNHDCGSGGTGEFSYTISLNPGTIYYFRAKAYNSGGWGYGSERKVVIYTASGGQKQFTTLLITYTITVSKTGTGSGIVIDTGINCGTDCSESYDSGTSVTLTATPDADSEFTGWSGDCSGTGTCILTMDSDKNVTVTFNLSDTTPPTVWVIGAPASWQNTDATANVSCSDADSGCDSATYKLKTYTSNPGTCSTNYADYTLTSPQTISSHLWLCGAAKDLVGNTGFSSPVEFTVDKEKPASEITSPLAGSTQTSDFLVSVTDTDTGGSGLDVCYYRTYDSSQGYTRSWTIRTCNSSQLITVGSTADCRTIGGTCTVYVYSYDNAGNQSDINLRSFEIKIITCNVSVPKTGLVNQWIEINISGSQGAIVEVRFASDLIGEPTDSWTNWYDWNISSDDWDASSKIMKWSFAETGNYEVWAEISDGTETASCYDIITIFECYPGQEDTCISGQGCSHIITCKPDGTWPACPEDECIRFTENDPHCPLCPEDRCVGPDWYDYPYYGITDRAYGDCSSECQCNTGTETGQPCEPSIEINSPNCSGITENCFNNIDDDEDGLIDCQDPDCPPTISCDICNHLECNTLGNYDWTCQPDPAGTDCGNCKECDGAGNCLYLCVGDGDETSCECISDLCIDCSDYYDGSCGYQGICHCGSLEIPIWECVGGNCFCVCQYDPFCEWEPDGYPEVIISPPSQEGNLGDELFYEVTVINPSEEEVTLTVTVSVPSDWDYWLDTLGMVEVTIGYGQSVKIPLRVKSSEEALSGEYDISVTAQNKEAPEYFGTGYATYEVPNQPPEKPISGGVSWDHCSVKALSIPIFHWIYSDLENNSQKFYEIQVNNNTDFSSPKFTYLAKSNSSNFKPTPTQVNSWLVDWMDWGDVLYWRVRVNDQEKDGEPDPDHWSDWLEPTEFTFSAHAGPWPEFTPSPGRVSLNQVVTFEDNSKCYTFPGNNEFNCQDLPAASYQWDFDYIEPVFTVDDWTKGNATTVYGDLGNYKVKLRITDDIDTCYSGTETLTVTLPLPEWMEIPPF